MGAVRWCWGGVVFDEKTNTTRSLKELAFLHEIGELRLPQYLSITLTRLFPGRDCRPPCCYRPPSLPPDRSVAKVMDEGFPVLDLRRELSLTRHDIHGSISRTLEEQTTQWRGTLLLALLRYCAWRQVEVSGGARRISYAFAILRHIQC